MMLPIIPAVIVAPTVLVALVVLLPVRPANPLIDGSTPPTVIVPKTKLSVELANSLT